MQDHNQAAVSKARHSPSFVEFVSLIALLMALTALSIDMMLPALPAIGEALGAQSANDGQLVISFYLAGFSIGQLLFGPVSDRYGRKMPLMAGLALYMGATLLAAAAPNMPFLFAARALQGIGAAAPRVIAIAIVRDRFGGREMARVMSFAMMVFIVVPILAPSMGQGILALSNWRAIFFMLLASAVAVAVWAGLRVPETRPASERRPLSAHSIVSALRMISTSRQTAGYMIAQGFVFGILTSYITSAEQIFVDVYALGAAFPLVFGAIATFMIGASVVNAAVVRRIGMRAVSHRALIGLLILCGALALAGFPPKPPLILFCVFMGGVFFCFGLITSNFNALAMERVGQIAGTASSLSGFYATAAGVLFGSVVGQAFDGTVRPLIVGIALLALATFVLVLFIERFRLGQPSLAPSRPRQ